MPEADNIPQQAAAQYTFDPPATLQPGSFTLRENESKNAQQASETYTMRAEAGSVLGSKGETLAFAKPQFDPSQFKELSQQTAELKAGIEDMEKNSQPLKDWKALDAEIQSVPVRVAKAEVELAKTQTKLAEVELSGSDEQKQMWRTNLVDDQAALENMRALEAQLPQSRVRLEQLAAAPEVMQYHGMLETKAAVDKSLAPLTTIAETSSPLYNNFDQRQTQADLGGDRALLARSVASYKVDQLLGTGVIAEEKTGRSEEHGLMGVSVQVDGAQITGKYQGKDCYLQANYADAKIQKGLSDLEVMDYITGQIDRHHGNVFVDPSSGKVTGIDNDLCFPERDREVMLQNDKALKEKAVRGLPMQVSEDTAKKVLSVTPEMLERELSSIHQEGAGVLSPAEIQGAVDRLQNLQQAIRNPDSGVQVVKEFNRDTYNAAVLRQKQIYAESNPDVEVDLQKPNFQEINGQRSLMGVPKASYIGAAVMQGRSYELNEGLVIDEVEFGMRDPDTAGVKASVAPAFAAFKAEEQKAKQVMRENPSFIENLADRNEAVQLKTRMDALQTKLDGYQNQLAKLENPGMADRARAAVTHGGVDRSKAFFQAKQTAALQEMKDLQMKMDNVVERAVVPLRNELYMTAEEKLGNQARAAQGVANSGNPRLDQVRSIATDNGVNLKMVELEGPNGEAQTPAAMRQIAANKEINAETWRERGNRMVEKDSPAEAKLAFLKADREEGLAAAIRNGAALLESGDGRLAPDQIDRLHKDMSAVKDTAEKLNVEEAIQNEQRLALYEQEVSQAVTPLLEARGFDAAEIRTFTEAAVEFGIETESASLANNPEVAKLFADDLKKGLETSGFQYSDHSESASKLHDALFQAYDTHAHLHIDEQTEIKRGHASFHEDRANAILQQVAERNEVALTPVNGVQAAQIEAVPLRVSVGDATGLRRSASIPALSAAELRLDGEESEVGSPRLRGGGPPATGPEVSDASGPEVKQSKVAKLRAQFEAGAKNKEAANGNDQAKIGGLGRSGH